MHDGLTLNLAQMIKMIHASIKANQPLHVIGSPGIGKTAILEQVAKSLGISLFNLILSQSDPSDLGGIPVPVPGPGGSGSVVRFPIGPIAQACARGGILFLDEYSQANALLQGASLTLINERRAGDFQLHPDTVIVLASNPTEESAGGQEITPPALNRMTHVYVSPHLDEVQGYLSKLGEGTDPTLHALALDYSATLGASPNLLQASPPAGVTASGKPWASPRAIVRALKVCASIQAMGENPEGELFASALEGNLGRDVAASWLAIRRNRAKLPSVDEICADPEKCKVPADLDAEIASLGVIAQVALRDANSAWIYVDRLREEIKVAGTRAIFTKAITPGKTQQKAIQARARATSLAVGSMNGATL